MNQILCVDCGVATEGRGHVQLYCQACSEKRDLLRKRLCARGHSLSPNQRVRNAEHAKQSTELVREAGALTNQEARKSIAWFAPEGPELLWQVRVPVPFSYAISKNHLYALRKTGHVALRRESRAKREEISLLIRLALAGRRVAHNKVWIDILVQKPNHRGDAVNVVDLVCDALKDAMAVDDRWFCIRRLDWEIVKTNPQLFIGIGQESELDCQVCSFCGQIKGVTEFNADKFGHLGIGRECKECRREGRRIAKKKDR